MAKASPLDRALSMLRGPWRPSKTEGAPGTAVYGGYVESRERSRELSSQDSRYRNYSDILLNTSIVAAGVRYFLNLVNNSEWKFAPSEADTGGEYAERLEQILTADPHTPFHRIIRRASMYRFYGFSVQEWTAMRRPDGIISYFDIAPRAQSTIERWDVDTAGYVNGILQRRPQDGREVYLPREKVLYLVDDSLNDSPEGLGVFRHLVDPARRLRRYESLEGFGFETDLRGVPVGYLPYAELAEMVAAGTMTPEQRDQIVKPIEQFIEKHIKNPELGLRLDSSVYATRDDAERPSNVRRFAVELLQGDSQSFPENARAIERLNRELARILGIEQLLLGATSAGSFALSEDKTNAFYLLVDGVLTEIREGITKDLSERTWMLNGWDMDLMPETSFSPVRFQDAENVAVALRDMAAAGAPLAMDDPAINDVRDMLDISRQDDDGVARMMRQEEDDMMAGMAGEVDDMEDTENMGDMA